MSKVIIEYRRLRNKQRAVALSEVGISNNVGAENKAAYVAEAVAAYRQEWTVRGKTLSMGRD